MHKGPPPGSLRSPPSPRSLRSRGRDGARLTATASLRG